MVVLMPAWHLRLIQNFFDLLVVNLVVLFLVDIDIKVRRARQLFTA